MSKLPVNQHLTCSLSYMTIINTRPDSIAIITINYYAILYEDVYKYNRNVIIHNRFHRIL